MYVYIDMNQLSKISRYNTRHVALKVLYLGWDYHGFAVQEDNEKTIEAALFDALVRTRLIESRYEHVLRNCNILV